MAEEEKIILGIDPGTNLMGYGIIKVTGGKISLITLGVIELKGYDDPYKKLQYIFNCTLRLITQYKVEELAIEAPFYGKNVQSMLKLGRAQGVAISAALSKDIPIFEYAPRKIKQAITGMGQASKEQVAGILKSMFKISELPENLDATDGLAAAVCHHYQKGKPQSSGSYKSWGDYVKKNPQKKV